MSDVCMYVYSVHSFQFLFFFWRADEVISLITNITLVINSNLSLLFRRFDLQHPVHGHTSDIWANPDIPRALVGHLNSFLVQQGGNLKF